MARTALVTGASSGIGRACAQRLTDDGFNVIVAGTHPERTEQVYKELDALGYVVADLATLAGVHEVSDVARHNKIDVLVNNAGRIDVGRHPTGMTPWNDYRELANLHAGAMLGIAQSVWPEMIARNDHARHIASCSEGAFRPTAMSGPYTLSKLMMVPLNWELQAMAAGSTATSNLLAIGPTRTEGAQEAGKRTIPDYSTFDQAVSDFYPQNLLGRAAEPEEVAAIVSFLAKPESGLIRGEMIRLGGVGLTIP